MVCQNMIKRLCDIPSQNSHKQQQWPPHPPHWHPVPPPQAAARGVGMGAATKRENSNTAKEGEATKEGPRDVVQRPLGCW